MTDLIDLFKKTISEPLVYQTSELLGESIESTSMAVNSIFPTLLGAVVMKGRTDGGAREILTYMSGNNINPGILHDLPSLLSGGPEVEILKANGADILKFLVGDRVPAMIDSIASSHGLRTSSASSLLKIVATLLMAAIARVTSEKNLNAGGLRDMLASQTVSVEANAPEHLAALTGLKSAEPTPLSAHGSLEGAPQIHDEKEQSTMSRLLPWIVLLIAALGLFYFLDKGSNVPPADMQNENRDSIENVRKMDSVRNQTKMDSPGSTTHPDSIQ